MDQAARDGVPSTFPVTDKPEKCVQNGRKKISTVKSICQSNPRSDSDVHGPVTSIFVIVLLRIRAI